VRDRADPRAVHIRQMTWRSAIVAPPGSVSRPHADRAGMTTSSPVWSGPAQPYLNEVSISLRRFMDLGAASGIRVSGCRPTRRCGSPTASMSRYARLEGLWKDVWRGLPERSAHRSVTKGSHAVVAPEIATAAALLGLTVTDARTAAGSGLETPGRAWR